MRTDEKVTREQSQEFVAQLVRNFPFYKLSPREAQEFIKNPKKYCQQFADSIAGKNGEEVALPPLPQDIPTTELKKKSYIYDFFGRANVDTVRATGNTLIMPKPKQLGKVTTERELLQRYPQLAGIDEDELIEKAVQVLPSKDVLLSSMVNAIIESEEGRRHLPVEVGTWIMSFCVDSDGTLCVLRCSRDSDGWDVHCGPVVLGYPWRAADLLFLATGS